ncbi:MAG TPA: alkaline phosphatase family protein [Gemmatimonadaceae bacterium]
MMIITNSVLRVLFGCALAIGSGCAKNSPIPRGDGALVFPAHRFDHFILIVLENEDATTVERVPYMDSLARSGASLRNYYAVAHPSYPNYLALVSGKTFAGSNPSATHDPQAYRAADFGDAQLLINAPTVVDGLQAKGLTWDAFAEDYPDTSVAPRSCDFTRASGNYARKHVPFLSFTEFHAHPALCAHVRNLRWLNKDSLAAYTFITPNMIHDGHDAPLDSAVTWLRGFLAPIVADSAAMKSTVIGITFDESANTIGDRLRGGRPNRVFTVLIGDPVKSGATSDTVFSHYSMLRTVEANYNLAPSLLPVGTPPIVGIWK